MRRRDALRIGLGAATAALVSRAASAGDDSPRWRRGPHDLRIVAEPDGDPVASASVAWGGSVLTTDSRGRVTLPDGCPWGTIEIDAPGYLRRRTVLRSAEEIGLWPLHGAPADALRGLVFGGSQTLVRALDREIAVRPGASIQENDGALRALRNAMAVASDALDLTFRMAEADDVVVVTVDISPGDAALGVHNASAAFYRDSRGFAIEGGRLVVDSRKTARDELTLLHELGHVCLWHSDDPRDAMFSGRRGEREDVVTFSARERRLARLIARRLPGTRFEDDDTLLGAYAVAVAAGRSRHAIVSAPGEESAQDAAPWTPPVLVAQARPVVDCTVFACA